MNKTQLLETLKKELSFLPAEELESRLAFYSEMIDDRIEEGLTEDDAVAAIGDVDEIISQLKSEKPPVAETLCENPYKNTKNQEPKQEQTQKPQQAQKRKLGAWAIILIVLGSPIWISLGAVALSIVITIYAVLWAVTGSLWAVPTSLAGVFLGGIAAGVVTIVYGNAFLGITLIGAAIACAGIAIFAGFGCFYLTRLAVFLSKTIARSIVSLFTRKEKNDA